MSASKRMMHIGLVMNNYGHHKGAWRLPEARASMAFDFNHYTQMALTAERGLFDLVFAADSLAIPFTASAAQDGRAPFISLLEPLTMMAALSSLTKNIGLACTATTTYTEPYIVARFFASLDIISGGRACWNLVTSGNPREADSFGLPEHPPADWRYRKATEFAEVVRKLWDSYTDDAFVYDKKNSLYFDPSRMRRLDHQGEFFKVKGPMNLARSPSGQPLISQAGQSEDGINLAAATADLVFAMQPTFEGAQKYYRTIKERAATNGRNPDQVKVLPGVAIYVGRTEEEAREKLQRVDDAFDIRMGLEALTADFGIDLSVYPLDAPFPRDLPPSDKNSSRREMMTRWAEREKLTLRQTVIKTSTHGHWQLTGTAASIADTLVKYYREGAADGFMLLPGILPEGLDDFVNLVIPELQQRGVFRTAYEGATLRDNFGLPRPGLC